MHVCGYDGLRRQEVTTTITPSAGGGVQEKPDLRAAQRDTAIQMDREKAGRAAVLKSKPRVVFATGKF